jgi:tetratricopeptide (TPR) repeat protein
MDKSMAPDSENDVTASELMKRAKALLARKKPRDAYELLQHAVVRHTDDPFLLSYTGWLKAKVEGKYRSGIEDCSRALFLFQKRIFVGDFNGEESGKAVLYLNLGRAYLAAGKRKDAYDTFHKGLEFDIANNDLIQELEYLGIRKKIPIPFLERSHPLNNFFGKMLRKSEKQPALT